MLDVNRYGPWAVIAGGSEGIGAGVALDCARDGINTLLIARKPEPLEDVAAQVRALGVEARTLALDLTAPDMMDQVAAASADIDVGLLVYNAGSSHRTGPYLGWPIEDVIRVIRLNVDGQALFAHHFGRRMAARGRGGIILMGSLAGVAGSPSVAAYSGAKAFSQMFSEALWAELRGQGIDVLHVVVGQTDTPAMARLGIVYPEGAGVSGEYVARLALQNIANGPVFVMPEMQEGFLQYVQPDRRAVVEINAGFILGNTEGTFAEPE